MGKKHLSLSVVTDVKPTDVSLKPMLIDFKHGALKKKEIPKLKCDLMKEKENPNNVMIIFNSDQAEYKYKGIKVDNDSELCQRFFVIRNKRTNKIRIATVNQLIVSRYLENTEIHQSNLNKINTSNNNKQIHMTELKRAFGSKRSQRAQELSSKVNINAEAVKTKMEESAIDVNVDVEDLNKTGNESMLLPKINPNATGVTNIYKLEDLFTSSEVLDSLTEVAQSVLKSCPQEPDSDYSAFFIKALQKLKPTVTVDKVKCVLYADALLRFISTEAKKLNNKLCSFNLCPLSKQIRNLVMSEFTVSSKTGRSRPIYMRDKAVCYALVLLMIAFDYKLEHEFTSNLFNNYALKSGLLILISLYNGSQKYGNPATTFKIVLDRTL
ncbi:RNA polymerase I subunit E isoform X2 [Lycorma delicatula]|uniref:RNA polymerase I subunit E isoform X2 n=1 Tax=Lycorma delicatula TaxID=130591 RepID=UPI003F51808B